MDMTNDEHKYLSRKIQPLTIDMTKDKYQGTYRLG